MSVGDNPIKVALDKVFGFVVARLEATDTGVPGLAEVLNGEPAWDCEGGIGPAGEMVCGQLWVRMLTLTPTTIFPIADITPPNCVPAMISADIEVGVIRCAPTVNENGAPPPPDAIAQSAGEVTDDAWAVMLGCLDAQTAFKADVVSGLIAMTVQQVGLGPEGGCVGTATRILVGLPRP